MLRYKDDPWLWDLDWTVGRFKMKKETLNSKVQKQEADTVGKEDTDEENMDILTFLEVCVCVCVRSV